MSESVDIIIKAEDAATPAMVKTEKAVGDLDAAVKKSNPGLDENIKRIKESGGQAKKSADLFKILAASLGGTEVARYAGQIGELADKTAQLAEVQKLGGAGALAFKVGIVGAVATASVALGTMIGNAIYGTKAWLRELERADEELKRLADASLQLNATRLSQDRAEIDTLTNRNDKTTAHAALLSSVKSELDKSASATKQAMKAVDDYDKSWKKLADDVHYFATGFDSSQEAKLKLEIEQKRLEALRGQSRELEKLPRDREIADLGQARSFIKALQDEVELLGIVERERDKARALQAIPQSGDEQDQALKLVAEKQRLQVAELTRQEWKRLYHEAMLLEVGGKERSDALKYQEQGLAKVEAEKLAAEQARIDLQKQASTKPLLQGKEERLLTRGTVDPLLQVAQKQLYELQKLNEPKSIGDILAEQEDHYSVVQ